MRRTVLSGLLALLAVATVAVASAASLDVRPATLTTASAAHPCAGTAEVTTPGTGTSFSSVAVSAPAACAGRTVQVALDAAGTIRQGSAPLAADGRATVELDGAYTASTAVTVAAVVDGWHLDGVWSYEPPTQVPALSCRAIDANGNPLPDTPCTAAVIGGQEWGYPAIDHFHRTIQVTTDSPIAVRWVVTINFSDTATFPFEAERITSSSGDNGLLYPGATPSCGPPRTVQLTGGVGQIDILAGKAASFQVGGTRGSGSFGGALLLACP